MDYCKLGALRQPEFILSPIWRTGLNLHHSAKTRAPFSGSRGASVTRLLVSGGCWRVMAAATSLWSSRPASSHLSALFSRDLLGLLHLLMSLYRDAWGLPWWSSG